MRYRTEHLKHLAVQTAANIEGEYAQWLESKRRVYPPNHIRASEIGHECERYIVLNMTRGGEAEPMPAFAIGNMEGGKHIERETIAMMMRDLRLEWVWGQRMFVDDKYNISGALDGGVELAHREVLPAEIKSCQGTIYDSIRPGLDGLHDLLNHRTWFVRKYLSQMTIYLHLSGERAGLLIFRDKWFWRLRVVPVLRDLVEPHLHELLARAERVNAHIADGTLPERVTYSPTLCGRCSLKQICLPVIDGGGVNVVMDERLTALLERREELAPMAREYKEVDDAVKGAVRELGPEVIIGAEWVVENKVYQRKRMQATGDKYDSTRTTIRKLDRPLTPLKPVNIGGDSDEQGQRQRGNPRSQR